MHNARLIPGAMATAMRAAGISAQQLARRVGLATVDINRMTSGNGGTSVYGLEFRRRIAAVLGVSVDELWRAPAAATARSKAAASAQLAVAPAASSSPVPQVDVDRDEDVWQPPHRPAPAPRVTDDSPVTWEDIGARR